MAEKKRTRKKKEELNDDNPTKVEYKIAKYLRSKLPTKKNTLLNHKVEYFIASKAIDCLLDSQWAKSSKNNDALFTSRESVVGYLDVMLKHKFFHRAQKTITDKKEVKKKKDDEKKKKIDENGSAAEENKDDEKKKKSKKDKKDTEERKKKKVKLDMHLEQLFKDGAEVYVWIYEPIPTKAWVIGSLLVVGAIVVCLFPLWPQSVRKGVYYLSIAAAGFLIIILGLAIIRLVVFCLVWLATMGKHHVWLLPNLTEDVGFFESFWPLYKYDCKTRSDDKKLKSQDSKENSSSEIDKKKSKKNISESNDIQKNGTDEEGFEVLEAIENSDGDKKND